MQKIKETPKTSKLRKLYIVRLVGRSIVLILSILIAFFWPEQLKILEGMNFFREFSIFHILWGIWVIDMVCQIFPISKDIALGSQKLFSQRFKPIRGKINSEALKKYITSTTKAAYKVLIVWIALLCVIAALFYSGTIDKTILFLITVCFYVCDLICVLIWCPFRLMMGNRCCTTCRIFNWDHIMMFSPIVFMGGFYALSLFVISVIVWLDWELCVLIFPERFWEFSNDALKCSNCVDKLCTQYCRKLR